MCAMFRVVFVLFHTLLWYAEVRSDERFFYKVAVGKSKCRFLEPLTLRLKGGGK